MVHVKKEPKSRGVAEPEKDVKLLGKTTSTSTSGQGALESAMVQSVKRESVKSDSRGIDAVLQGKPTGNSGQGELEKRILRSRYLAVKNLISNERDDIIRQDSKSFKSILTEVEALHEKVKKPREQVVDAETLLGITSTLAASVRSQNNDGVTPSDLVTAILKNFGYHDHRTKADDSQNMVSWEHIGLSVSHIFAPVPGCCTMIGPMSNEVKQRKAAIYRKRTKPTESTRPEEIDRKEQEKKTDTDSNMSTMFDILKKNRRVCLESLLLNRLSFAQTVENIFALSFLVKDGRAEITVDDTRSHFVSPRNAPATSAVASGSVSYHHFVFRFDFRDWKAMMNAVKPGEELMPHRTRFTEFSSRSDAFGSNPQQDLASCVAQPHGHSTPIRKLTRNRGLVVQEDSIVEDSVEKELPCKKPNSIIKGKRLVSF